MSEHYEWTEVHVHPLYWNSRTTEIGSVFNSISLPPVTPTSAAIAAAITHSPTASVPSTTGRPSPPCTLQNGASDRCNLLYRRSHQVSDWLKIWYDDTNDLKLGSDDPNNPNTFFCQIYCSPTVLKFSDTTGKNWITAVKNGDDYDLKMKPADSGQIDFTVNEEGALLSFSFEDEAGATHYWASNDKNTKIIVSNTKTVLFQISCPQC